MRTAKEITAHSMSMLRSGKVRNHKLNNTSSDHGAEATLRERQLYRDFLPSKLSRILYEMPERVDL